jgi:hypothetical protein
MNKIDRLPYEIIGMVKELMYYVDNIDYTDKEIRNGIAIKTLKKTLIEYEELIKEREQLHKNEI